VRFVIRLFGRDVFELTTDPDAPEREQETNSGGQFEIGFTPPPPPREGQPYLGRRP
jgi:hypothetical protein